MTAKKILILGGTSWLGGAVAELALRHGHEVTCLARGESGSAPDGVRFVTADRWKDGAYDEVAGEGWDCVLDVSWQPVLVRGAVEALAGRAAHWVYVSSCSVYSDDSRPGRDESDTLHPAWTGTGKATIDDYGPAKVACESACLDGVGADRAFICRPGLIAGYGDRSDRYGYWPARVDRTSDADPAVLVPPLTAAVQVVDVVDLAAWTVRVIEEGTTGVFNAVGDVYTMADVIRVCADATGKTPTCSEADDAWLAAHEVEPWMGEESLPLWLPPDDYAGFMTRTNDAAKAVGLELSSLAATTLRSLDWEREAGLDRDRGAGLTPAREKALLQDLGRTPPSG
jgi:nucleoside-diphosphate-sugar epimerase